MLFGIGRCDSNPDAYPGQLIVGLNAHAQTTTGWLARAVAHQSDPYHKVGFEFLEPFDKQLSRAGNGDKFFLVQSDGLYVAEGMVRSLEKGRFYLKVVGKTISELTLDETIRAVLGVNPAELARLRAEALAAKKAQAQAQANAEAELAAEWNLPDLIGTPRQIEYAQTVRNRQLAQASTVVAEKIARAQEEGADEHNQAEIDEAEACFTALKGVRKAAQWLDLKHLTGKELMRDERQKRRESGR